jgi:hypothetical protein
MISTLLLISQVAPWLVADFLVAKAQLGVVEADD